MTTLTALYKLSEDSAAFDAHYNDIHTPLAKKMEGLRKMELTKVKKMLTPPNGMLEAQPYLVCTMYFDDSAALKAGMNSEGGKAAAADLASFAGPLVSMIIGETNEVPL